MDSLDKALTLVRGPGQLEIETAQLEMKTTLPENEGGLNFRQIVSISGRAVSIFRRSENKKKFGQYRQYRVVSLAVQPSIIMLKRQQCNLHSLAHQ